MDESARSNDRLRAWYLAVLRSNAMRDLLGVEGGSMTPAALINADSQLISKLVQDEPSPAAMPVATKQTVDNEVVLVITGLLLLLICAGLLPVLLLR
jgi:hypothetical protein